MARTVRIAYSNLVASSTAVIVPSSEATGFPRAALQRQGLSDVWRSKTGWTIVAGDNDVIEFNRGGAKTATITAGTYATGAALATAIFTALEAADSTPVWACSYSGVTFKFTISSDLAFVLLFGTGASGLGVSVKSAHIDLGYAGSDTGSATSAVAGTAVYQSRHVIDIDLGSAQAVTLAIVRGHNISASGAVVQFGSTATMVGTGYAFTGDYSASLSGTDPLVVFGISSTKRYHRLRITDVTNTAGYAEVGIWFTGVYVQPSTPESVEWSLEYEQLSETFIAVNGANHVAARSRRRAYHLMWRTNSSTDVSLFEALDLACPAGTNFFISFDATDNPTTSTVYGFLRQGLMEQRNDGALYVMSLTLVEVLG